MPRDAAGNYTLPLPDRISGTLIESEWANTTMDDLAVAMTDSLSRSGSGAMSAPLRNVAGSQNAPSITFNADLLSGLYSAFVGDVRMSVGGTDRMRWLPAGILPQFWDSVNGEWRDLGSGGITWRSDLIIPPEVSPSIGYVTRGNQSTLMPATPVTGTSIAFADLDNDWGADNFLTLDGNGNTFTQDGAETYELNLKGAFAQFSFINDQWEIINFGRLSDAYGFDTENFVLKAGDTMTGQLEGITPVADADLTRKDYVDSSIATPDGQNVKITGAQTIAGVKTFSSLIAGSVNGNAATATNATTAATATNALACSGNSATATNATNAATAAACSGNSATVTNGVYTTGNQNIAGIKTFTGALAVPNPSANFFRVGNARLLAKCTFNTSLDGLVTGYGGTWVSAAVNQGTFTLTNLANAGAGFYLCTPAALSGNIVSVMTLPNNDNETILVTCATSDNGPIACAVSFEAWTFD